MTSYPAKPYVVPDDDWFNNNSSNFKKKFKAKGIKNISTMHEFFYRQSDLKIGGSENYIQTNLEKVSSKKIIISSIRDNDESLLSSCTEKYSNSEIPAELKSIKKRSFQGNNSYKISTNKKIFNFRSFFLDLKSAFLKIISRKKRS